MSLIVKGLAFIKLFYWLWLFVSRAGQVQQCLETLPLCTSEWMVSWTSADKRPCIGCQTDSPAQLQSSRLSAAVSPSC